jgi:low temperature requirement protein LtrA
MTQLFQYLLANLTPIGVGQTVFLLLVLWWAWIYTT